MEIGFAVLAIAALAAAGFAVVRLWRDQARVRALLAAEKGQPTEVVLKRMLRQRVHRDELAAVLFSREAVLEASPLPVLILDGEGRVARVNAAARVALGGVDIGAPAADLAPELGRAVAGVLSGPPVDQVEMVAGAERRVWLAHLRSHPDADGRAAVAVLVDVTEDVDFREARRLFSAAVSHELRTPLQRIVGLVDTLALPLSDGERAELVQAAEHEVQRMRELVDEMLLLAALDRGQAALSEGDCDASAVAERVVAARVARARQSGMTLRIDAAPGLRVPIGEQLLEVVIGNVLDNALKYAGEGAEVEVQRARACWRGRGGRRRIPASASPPSISRTSSSGSSAASSLARAPARGSDSPSSSTSSRRTAAALVRRAGQGRGPSCGSSCPRPRSSAHDTAVPFGRQRVVTAIRSSAAPAALVESTACSSRSCRVFVRTISSGSAPDANSRASASRTI